MARSPPSQATRGQALSVAWTCLNMTCVQAMTAALSLVQQLLPYTLKYTQLYDFVNHPFVRGKCALAISWPDVFKASQLLGPFKHRVGCATLPGSAVVLNRKTGAHSSAKAHRTLQRRARAKRTHG